MRRQLFNKPNLEEKDYIEGSFLPYESPLSLVGFAADRTNNPFEVELASEFSYVDAQAPHDMYEEKRERLPFTSPEVCPVIAYKRAEPRVRKITGFGQVPQYVIYSLTNLVDLLGQLEKPKKGVKKKQLRYLVTTDFQLYFAFEGEPNEYIPPHDVMTGKQKVAAQCYAAGNIFLKKDDAGFYLYKINHESGDFLSHYDSLKWVLASLLAHENVLPPGFVRSTIGLAELEKTRKTQHVWTVLISLLKQELKPHIDLMSTKPPTQKNRTAAEIVGSSMPREDIISASLMKNQRAMGFFKNSPSTPPRTVTTSPLQPAGPPKRTKFENSPGQDFYNEASSSTLDAFWNDLSTPEFPTRPQSLDSLSYVEAPSPL
ncbi:MAG: hypothetical protein H0U75_11505 [Legionella sp.]|nr:hypothetical protein [Legionella sp.]